MSSQNYYVDLHCHPALKPLGKSFNYTPNGRNSLRKRDKRSIWRYDPPSIFDKVINYLSGLTKFSQSNFTSLSYGDMGVVVVSLYPLEKWFVRNKVKNELILDLAANFALGIGDKRIDHIQKIENYFTDLLLEYDFYRQLDGTVISLPEGKFRYKIVRNYNEIEAIRANEDLTKNVRTICVILSIEGMHVLNTGLKKIPDEVKVLQNVRQIKNWTYKPFFVGIAHHFFNDLCGHAQSLSPLIRGLVDQSEGINTGFTDLGKKVVEILLNPTNGQRILIDVKHMSTLSRKQYYHWLDTHEFGTDHIPIIVSHGAANGLTSFDNPVMGRPQTASKLQTADINFYDEEILKIAKSDGIFGLQLDERRIASESTLKQIKHAVSRNKIMHYRSALLWNQVQHVIELLDNNDLFAWDMLAIGSDFDGIIDPLNSFWTAEQMPQLADFLERHAYNYLKTHTFKNEFNAIPADEIIDRIFTSNANRFFKKYF